MSMVHQRGPKYELLIKELIKYTPVEFEDRTALQKALVSMKETNAVINSCISKDPKNVKVKFNNHAVSRVRVCSSQRFDLDKKVSGYRSRGHINT